MSYLIAIFPTTRNAIRAQKACKNKKIPCRMIPVPKELSSECGIALEFDIADDQKARELFTDEKIEAGFHYVS